MAYERHPDGSTTISATLSADEWSGFLLAWGYLQASAESLNPAMLWTFVSILNRFMDGNPRFTPYEIPADRSQPFQPQHLTYVDVPEPTKQ